jgi:rod shape-determining protein MreC
VRAKRVFFARRSRQRRGTPTVGGRFSAWVYAGLFGLAFVLFTLDMAGNRLANGARGLVTDASTPVLEAVSGAILAARKVITRTRTIADAATEVERLRAENAELRPWRRKARELEARARRYETLLNLQPDPDVGVVTARAIQASNGRFSQELVVNAGRDAGLREGNAVLGPEGLIGRIIVLGARSGRVLLVTDLASRIPVHVGGERHHAILAGTGGGEPTLTHLPAGARVGDGDLVVTSGEGRLLPAGLPVGVVRLGGEGGIGVALATRPEEAEFVRIFDYFVPVDVSDERPPLPAAMLGTQERKTVTVEALAAAVPAAGVPGAAGAE